MAGSLDVAEHTANLKRLYETCPLEDHEINIRLLRFAHSTHEDDEICCSLESLYDGSQSHPKYAAISYTWGDPTELKTINVNGLQINVRANCWYALWQVRRLRTHQLVWIDSICINQDDLTEKSAQVVLMGEIYTSCSDLYACVGPHEDDSDHLISQSPVLVESYDDQPAQHGFIEYQWESSFKYLRAHRKVLSGMERDTYERLKAAAIAFGNRKYWTRAWVAQELSLSRKQWLLVGEGIIEWPSMCTLIFAVEAEFRSRQYAKGVSENLALTYYDSVLDMKFKDMFSLYLDSRGVGDIAQHDLAASDSRDRIFAIRKLTAWPAMLGEIYPDYTKTKVQVAREMLRYFEAQEDLPVDHRSDTLFDFALNLLRILDISVKGSEFQDLLRQSEAEGTAELPFARGRGFSVMHKQILLGVPLGLERSYHISRNGPAYGTDPKGNKKCVLGDDTRHWIALLNANAKRGDVVVRVMREGMLLILRQFADFFEIVGSGFISFRDGACTGGPFCDCYDDAVHIMDTYACETEIVIDEIDLWSFVSREWNSIREWNPTGDTSDSPSDLPETLCAHKLSSLAIRRPTDSALLEAGEEGYQHWVWNVHDGAVAIPDLTGSCHQWCGCE